MLYTSLWAYRTAVKTTTSFSPYRLVHGVESVLPVECEIPYSHSRTCTCSSVCRRLHRLVEFHICYLLDRASVHEISSLVTWFQCMTDIFNYYGDLDPFISSSFMEIMILCIYSSWRFWSIYIVHGDDHTCHILYHAYSWPLYSYVSRTTISTCSYVQSLIIVL